MKLTQIDRNNVSADISEIRFCNDCSLDFSLACTKQKWTNFFIVLGIALVMIVLSAIGERRSDRETENYNYYYDYYENFETKPFNASEWTYNSAY